MAKPCRCGGTNEKEQEAKAWTEPTASWRANATQPPRTYLRATRQARGISVSFFICWRVFVVAATRDDQTAQRPGRLDIPHENRYVNATETPFTFSCCLQKTFFRGPSFKLWIEFASNVDSMDAF